MFSIGTICLDRRRVGRKRAVPEQKARCTESAFHGCRIAQNYVRRPCVCTEGTPPFRPTLSRSWLSKVECTPSLPPLQYMLGHNDRGWSLCLSCKSRGNFERLFRPVHPPACVLSCLLSWRPARPNPNRLVIKRSYSRPRDIFSGNKRETRKRRRGGSVTTEMSLSRRSVVPFPNYFIAPPRRQLSVISKPTV